MQNYLHFVLLVFTGFFAIMNPIANTPIFIGLVSDLSKKEKKAVSVRACFIAFIIITLFVLAGKQIFQLFDITIPSFKITGGIMIFYIGFEMLQAKKSRIQHNAERNAAEIIEAEKNVAVSPLAIPILAGPGTIVTAMNFVTDADLIHMVIVISTFAVMLLITHFLFAISDSLVKLVGNNILQVIGKIMGLILAIIGTGMVIDGIKLIL